MARRVVVAFVVGMMALATARPATAEVLAVPDFLRHVRAPMDETIALRATGGAVVGEQRFQATIADDRLGFDVSTRFTSGEEWDERGEMDLAADGFRSRRFDKTVRKDGRVVQEQHVDFSSGKIGWLVDGVFAERTMTFAPDTYIGPMLAIVLGGVPERRPAATSFAALVFRPDPMVVTVRAEAVDEEAHPLGTRVAAATKLRVKADLGPVKNVLFASLIPTHYFWFTRSDEPEFVGFEGALSNGLEVTMTASASLTTTAHAAGR